MLRLSPQTGAQALHSSQEEEEREEAQEEALWWIPSPKSGVQGKGPEGPFSWSIRSPFIVVVKLIFEALHIARGVSGSLETPLLAPDTSLGKGMHLVWCGLLILT